MELLQLLETDTQSLAEQLDDYSQVLKNTIIPDTSEEITSFQKNLKNVYADIQEKRKKYFEKLTTSQKLIIAFENEIIAKGKEAKEKLLELEKVERELIEAKRKQILIDHIMANCDADVQFEFQEEFEKYVETEKTRNILTSTDKLKKADLEKCNAVIQNLSAGFTLEKIGQAQFKANGYNYLEALKFQVDQKKLIEAQIEKDRLAKLEEEARQKAIEEEEARKLEEARNQVASEIEKIEEDKKPDFVIEDVPIETHNHTPKPVVAEPEYIEVPEPRMHLHNQMINKQQAPQVEKNKRYMYFEYDKSQSKLIEKLVNELRAMGVLVISKKTKEEL